jgi:hypothetical protein
MTIKPPAKAEESLASRYTALSTNRNQFLRRAHECAKLTIPALYPHDSDRPRSKDQIATTSQPWQSIGSSGVNALTAKLVMALLPANAPFFQFVMGAKEREELLGLDENEQREAAAAIEARLQKMEYDVLEDIELSALRNNAFRAFKHLLVGGNYTLYVGDKIKGFPLDRYVVRRDGNDEVVELIVKEAVHPMDLPQAWLKDVARDRVSDQEKIEKGEELDIYTVLKRTGKNSWASWQEVLGQEVPKTRGRFTEENNPWLVLRMVSVDGEDYGRAYVEELFGDLKSAEDLSMSIVQGGMIAAMIKWLVKPSGMTDIDDLEESDNGDYVPGNPEDVGAVRVEKNADFAVAERVLIQVTNRLERAFLMHSSVQRSGERVTAHEISVMTQELEDTLGGYYALLGAEFQLPIVRLWTNRMQRQGRFPKVPKNSIRPKIITGVEALGRGQSLVRLRGFFQDVTQLGPILQTMPGKFSLDQIITMIANGHGVDVSAALVSDAELQLRAQQQQEQQQAAAIAERAAGPAAGALASAATQQPQEA